MASVIVLNPTGSTEVWNVSTYVWDTADLDFSGSFPPPTAFTAAYDATITPYVTGVPEISVLRTDDNATVTLVSATKYDIRIYRSNDHRQTFYNYIDGVESGTDFVDNAVWNTYAFQWDSNNVDYDEFSSSKNYKYKVSFIATGTQNGVPFEVESQTSDPVYTVGNRKL